MFFVAFRCLALGAALLISGLSSTPTFAAKRVALVIGNSAYKIAGELPNPRNDAADISAIFKGFGFQVVEGIDLDKAAFDRKIRDFATALQGAELGVFFYAGHGLQVGGQNYLVPTDAELSSQDGLDFEMVRLDLVHRTMERATDTNVIFLDACRNNPLERNLRRAMGTRNASDIGKGLAPVQSGTGTLISFSTQPGNVAIDGTGRNSPFAAALIRHLGGSSDDLSAILIAVRNDVMKETQRSQVPWEHSALTGRLYFGTPPQTASAEGPGKPAELSPSEAERAWAQTKDTTNVALLEAFASRFKDTFYADLAKVRIEELKKQILAKSLPPQLSASAQTEKRRTIEIFNDGLKRVRDSYISKPDDVLLITNAVNGMAKQFSLSEWDASAAEADLRKMSGRELDATVSVFGRTVDEIQRKVGKEIGEFTLVAAAFEGMFSNLDPHSSYLTASQFRDMQVQTRGEFGGVGMEVTMDNGAVKVVTPLDGTPAARAGILANDIISHVNREALSGQSLEQAVQKMRGPVNSSVALTVIRSGRDAPFDVKVIRDTIRINAVRTRLEGDGEVGYIKITTFNEQAHASLVQQIPALVKTSKKLKGFIVDLRNNPGGLLDQAVAVADDFLEKGLVVSVKGRREGDNARQEARAGDIANGKKIIVLVNGGTASAAEIVTGALKDHKRATIVGTRTFGKGSVQTIIPMGENGAIRLTTALYYTPSGHSIQARGIEPDVVVEQDIPDDLKDKGGAVKGEANLPKHLAPPKNAPARQASPAYVPTDPMKDAQLQAAVRMLRQ